MNRTAGKGLMLVLATVLAAGLLEAAGRVLYARAVAAPLAAQKNSPEHYYTATADRALAYVLKPGCRIEKDGRFVRINAFGIRDDRDDLPAGRTVALLGDSVLFGIGLSQEQTPAAALQRRTGGDWQVLNFGVPGYGLEEIQRFLEIQLPVFRPARVCYVLNLNDFSRRNTRTEGSDNGLYRMYAPPAFKVPFFLRKAVYRLMKGGRMSSVRWYRWLYRTSRAELLPLVRQMAAAVRRQGGEFSVVLFPPAVAYENGDFALQAEFDEIARELQAQGIAVRAPVREFGAAPRALQDDTDHLTPAGAEILAEVIWQDLKK